MKRHILTLICMFLAPALLLAQDDTKKEPAKKVEPAKKIVVPFELLKTQHIVVNVKIMARGRIGSFSTPALPTASSATRSTKRPALSPREAD